MSVERERERERGGGRRVSGTSVASRARSLPKHRLVVFLPFLFLPSHHSGQLLPIISNQPPPSLSPSPPLSLVQDSEVVVFHLVALLPRRPSWEWLLESPPDLSGSLFPRRSAVRVRASTPYRGHLSLLSLILPSSLDMKHTSTCTPATDLARVRTPRIARSTLDSD